MVSYAMAAKRSNIQGQLFLLNITTEQHLIFVICIRCFTRNDTNRRIEEEVLEAQNKINRENAKAKAVFIRNVFHEIRTPLHALSSFFSNPNPLREEFIEMKHHTGPKRRRS
jgi:signal transduction histidine kinase